MVVKHIIFLSCILKAVCRVHPLILLHFVFDFQASTLFYFFVSCLYQLSLDNEAIPSDHFDIFRKLAIYFSYYAKINLAFVTSWAIGYLFLVSLSKPCVGIALVICIKKF